MICYRQAMPFYFLGVVIKSVIICGARGMFKKISEKVYLPKILVLLRSSKKKKKKKKKFIQYINALKQKWSQKKYIIQMKYLI